MPIQYTSEQLLELATAPLRYQTTVDSLLEFYGYIKQLWSRQAIKSLAHQHDLNLRITQDKLQFAQIAASIELDSYVEPSQLEAELETVKQELVSAKETIKKQEKAIALLKAGKPLNGRQETPIFKVFGQPTTKDMLVSNYRKLRVKEHPDASSYPSDIASQRFAFLKSAYVGLLNGWDEKYNPTLTITQEELTKAIAAKLPFPASSFH
ncbi:hypothetical protein [Pleurocapsa sp. FMAR1]|uniref:hypothetical protein n=1 Tax=Pleurocapsa sp. FMAR1 TaxID=3040204 RepID=UPI0029C7A114|nr:hypothetical protein [Pleurocapsa sp. FMAR1]